MDAKRHSARLAAIVLVISASAVPVFAQVAPPRPPQPTACRPYEVVQSTFDGDYDRALALSQECAESHMRLVNPAGLVLDSSPGSTQSAFSAGWAFAFLCASAQLQALTGDTGTAQTTLERAERFLNTWPGFRSFLVETKTAQEMLAATRGFIEERAGRIGASTLAYESAGEVGASRRAVIALSQKNDAQAAALANRAKNIVETAKILAGMNASPLPTALAVLGALAELRGDPFEAFGRYYDSEQEMRRMLEPYATSAALPEGSGSTRVRPDGVSHSYGDFQPMLLAERPRVMKALAKGPTTIAATANPLPEVEKAQAAFNDWLRRQRARTVAGIAFRPQYPRFFAGFTREDRDSIRQRRLTPPKDFDVNAVLILPESIKVTGLFDRDTLARDLYMLIADLLSVAVRAGVSPADLLSSGEPRGLPPDRLNIANELRAALTELQTLHRRLQSVGLKTNSGAILTAFDEVKLRPWTADAATAHMVNLTPTIGDSFRITFTSARDRITAARRLLSLQ